jgi:hypothetical protein
MSDVPPHRSKSPAPTSAEPALPSAPLAGVDGRVLEAWCTWLSALATDAEAALSAAMAYKELDGPARDTWLSALEQDARELAVPRIAVYAPLLAVESDPARRARITQAIGPEDAAAAPRVKARAMRGIGRSREQVVTIVSPLYLEFVQVLACGYRSGEGFLWVRHDPIVKLDAAPRPGDAVMGAVLEATPLKSTIDDLAVVVLEHGRSGRELPEALRMFADLFEPFESVPPSD